MTAAEDSQDENYGQSLPIQLIKTSVDTYFQPWEAKLVDVKYQESAQTPSREATTSETFQVRIPEADHHLSWFASNPVEVGKCFPGRVVPGLTKHTR